MFPLLSVLVNLIGTCILNSILATFSPPFPALPNRLFFRLLTSAALCHGLVVMRTKKFSFGRVHRVCYGVQTHCCVRHQQQNTTKYLCRHESNRVCCFKLFYSKLIMLFFLHSFPQHEIRYFNINVDEKKDCECSPGPLASSQCSKECT